MSGPAQRSVSPPVVATSSLVELLRSAARLDRTQSDPVVSLRNAVGVAVPLAIGALAGSAALGLPSTIGALQTAFADRPGAYRLRMLRMVGTALAASVTSGLAVLLSHTDLGSAALLLVLAFAAGLLLTGGPSATQVGVAATAAALIIGHRPEPASAALHVALLILLGGLGQVVLAIAAWPLRRHRPERLALAGLYRELAAVGRRPPGTDVGPPAGESLIEVRSTLYGLGHDHGPSVEAYRVLLDEAERIRREMIVLSGQAERLRAAGADSGADAIRQVLHDSADVLEEVGAALAAGRPIDAGVVEPVRERVQQALHTIERPALGAGTELTRRAAGARVRGLAGQLRAAVETARTGASEGSAAEHAAVPGGRALRAPLAILRANLSPSSAVLRHAGRVGVLVCASDLVVRLVGVGRGYWIPLTILVVLRPDFASTFQRATMRVVGTIIGLLAATELVHWVPAGEWYQIALVALFFFGMRFAGPGNLGLSAMSLAALVVVLLALDGIAPHATLVLRTEDTLLGGALALLAMLASPLWEREVVPVRLAELLAAYRNYLAAISDPAASAQRLQRTRTAARLARTNARASVDRARVEPVGAGAEVELGEAVLVHSHRIVNALLTVDAVRSTVHGAGGAAEVDELLRHCARALTSCEQAVRTLRVPRSPGSLRADQEALAEALGADPQRVGGVEVAGALIDASDRLANSVDTLVSELRRQLADQRRAGYSRTTPPRRPRVRRGRPAP